MILSIDPGQTKSAWLAYNGTAPTDWATLPNDEIREVLLSLRDSRSDWTLAIESVESYGKPVGQETFDTVRWIGRFEEIWRPRPVLLVPRRHVKRFLCDSVTAKDPHVWQALVDKFGGKEVAVGRKATPGPLFGITAHERSALAVAVTVSEFEIYRPVVEL